MRSEEDIRKIAIRLSYQLQEQGYIEYDSSKSIFCINKPHLVIIPTKKGAKYKLIGARDTIFIKSILEYCRREGSIILKISTEEDKLVPQEITLHQKKANHEKIKHLAKMFDIIFMKDNLYTQFALASCFPDISYWENYINRTSENEISDLEGGFIFDIESLKFIKKPENFNRELSLIKYTNIDGYKTIYKLWHDSMSYDLPDQQIGIYIFLYLYTKKSQENFTKSKNEIGQVLSKDETDELVIAQSKSNIFIYDEENMLFAIPFTCKLPKYFTISLRFMSDKAPSIHTLVYKDINVKQKYIIYNNISKLFVSNQILIKLCKRDIKYRCNYKKINI